MAETAAAPAAAATTESAPAQNAGAQSQNPGSQAPGPQGSAPPVANQPTKTELKDLAEDNMDAMVTMKVNGQVKKMSVRDALKQAELAEGAQFKMQQMSKVRKEAEQLLNLAQNDPDEFFRRTGKDPDQYAEQRLMKKYEKLAMTPEQIKAQERDEKLKNYEAKDNQTREGIISQIKNMADNLPKEYLEALKNATPEQLHGELQAAQGRYNQAREQVEKEFLAAWESTGFPKDTIFGTWMSSLMHSSQVQKNAGQREQALQADEAAAIVKENFMSAVSRITGSMDAEAIHQLLGSETMKRLREFDVQRVTGKSVPSSEHQGPERKPASQTKNPKFVNEAGWNAIFKNIG